MSVPKWSKNKGSPCDELKSLIIFFNEMILSFCSSLVTIPEFFDSGVVNVTNNEYRKEQHFPIC